jgi:hypothetical protein
LSCPPPPAPHRFDPNYADDDMEEDAEEEAEEMEADAG